MATIGKTIDELDSFVGDPSLGSLIAVRDMTLANTDADATKKFSIADLIILIHNYREHQIGQVSLTANVSTPVAFPTAFATTPEVGILRTTQGGVHVGIAVDISTIVFDGFTATAIEDCVLTYIAGEVVV